MGRSTPAIGWTLPAELLERVDPASDSAAPSAAYAKAIAAGGAVRRRVMPSEAGVLKTSPSGANCTATGRGV